MSKRDTNLHHLDRTFEEIDLLFAAKTPARKFAQTKVDAYAETEARVVRQDLDNSDKA